MAALPALARSGRAGRAVLGDRGRQRFGAIPAGGDGQGGSRVLRRRRRRQGCSRRARERRDDDRMAFQSGKGRGNAWIVSSRWSMRCENAMDAWLATVGSRLIRGAAASSPRTGKIYHGSRAPAETQPRPYDRIARRPIERMG